MKLYTEEQQYQVLRMLMVDALYFNKPPQNVSWRLARICQFKNPNHPLYIGTCQSLTTNDYARFRVSRVSPIYRDTFSTCA